MKTEIIQSMTETFEGHAQQTESSVEFWLARNLQHLLGYGEWRNFNTAISKAKTACEVSGHAIRDHFVDVNKTIQMPKGATKEVPDIKLTRYACYLIAQNGDSKKPEIAFAQTYFAIQTRRAELIEQRLLKAKRVTVRKRLRTTEKDYPRSSSNRPAACRASPPSRWSTSPTIRPCATPCLNAASVRNPCHRRKV